MPWSPQDAYDRGLRGTYADSAAHDRLTKLVKDQGQSFDAADAIRTYGLSGSGEGRLSPLFSIIEKVFPGSLPASAQGVGRCVAHDKPSADVISLKTSSNRPLGDLEMSSLGVSFATTFPLAIIIT